MQPVYEVGEIVEIIDNVVDHEFEIGQHVRIIALDSDGEVDCAESLDGTETWWLVQEEVRKIRN